MGDIVAPSTPRAPAVNPAFAKIANEYWPGPDENAMDWTQTSKDRSPLIISQRNVPFHAFPKVPPPPGFQLWGAPPQSSLGQKRSFSDISDGTELTGRNTHWTELAFVERTNTGGEATWSSKGVALSVCKQVGLGLYYAVLMVADNTLPDAAKRRVLPAYVLNPSHRDVLVRATTPRTNRYNRNIYLTPPRPSLRSPRSARTRDMPGRFPGATSSPPFFKKVTRTLNSDNVEVEHEVVVHNPNLITIPPPPPELVLDMEDDGLENVPALSTDTETETDTDDALSDISDIDGELLIPYNQFSNAGDCDQDALENDAAEGIVQSRHEELVQAQV